MVVVLVLARSDYDPSRTILPGLFDYSAHVWHQAAIAAASQTAVLETLATTLKMVSARGAFEYVNRAFNQKTLRAPDGKLFDLVHGISFQKLFRSPVAYAASML